VIFNKPEYDQALELRDYVEELMNQPSSSQTAATTISIADELLKLKQLLDAGVLSQEEFDTQKTKLLNN
ncbi:MAG: SHOCT domain-containing protein, partial [Exiguobacterium sp.]|nr:SHOCT domain-containing protein [Exiguobacterium sp.]